MVNDIPVVDEQGREPGEYVDHLRPTPVLDECGEGQRPTAGLARPQRLILQSLEALPPHQARGRDPARWLRRDERHLSDRDRQQWGLAVRSAVRAAPRRR